MIVGTAGHIDHGKTSLIRALTGVETDRLKEEKARGISIELGYAYTLMANGETLGLIDVPGHERLIHTMAAGASGIDFGLLVVAADDGVMPQTREHLAILSLLGVRQGAVAISKKDRVDDARLDSVRSQVADLVAGTFLEGEPIFPVSTAAQAGASSDNGAVAASSTGLGPGASGVDALRDHLHAAAQSMAARGADGLFRLAVDRVFTLKGHGTVVTGTVHDGRFRLDEPPGLRLMPSGQKLRVRSIHTQNLPAMEGRAGQRCALNLAGVDKDAIARGDWVADDRCFNPSRNVDVTLRLLASAATPLRVWTPLHIHLGASHYLAHIVPLQADTLEAGQEGWAQLVFDQPVCALPGDRFIARDAQARNTVGGGVVLDPNAPARKRRSPERLAWLQAVSLALSGGGLPALLMQAPWGLDENSIWRLMRCGPDRCDPPGGALWVHGPGGRTGLTLTTRERWDALADKAAQTLRDFHQNSPEEPGLGSARLRRMALPAMPESLWTALCDSLVDAGRLVRNGPWLHLPDHSTTLAPHEAELAQRLLPLIRAGGFNPPWVRDLASSLNEPENELRQLLLKLMRRGELYQVVPDLFYHQEEIVRLADLLTSAGGADGVGAAQFRDLTGLGRKRSIQILEFFDRTGFTRRLRDRHVPRKDGASF